MVGIQLLAATVFSTTGMGPVGRIHAAVLKCPVWFFASVLAQEYQSPWAARSAPVAMAAVLNVAIIFILFGSLYMRSRESVTRPGSNETGKLR